MNLEKFISLYRDEVVLTAITIGYIPITKRNFLLNDHNYKKVLHKNI